MTNRAAVLHGPGDIQVAQREVPVPGAHEVLVRIAAVGICGSDVHYFEHGRIGDFVVDAPMVIGHEAAGTIVDVGTEVDPVRLGERVALEPGVPDGTCAQCRQGRYNLCSEVRFFATPPYDGAITDHVAIDARYAHAVPRTLALEHAALAEPVSVGVAAARRAGVTAGDRVLITGAGPIGLLTAQVVRAFGASEVILTDTKEYRLGVARDHGFTTFPAGSLGGPDVDVLLECSGSESALTEGSALLAPRGRVVLVGMGADSLALNLPLIQQRELTITGVFRYANTYPLAIELLASGAVDGGAVISHRLSLEETAAALSLNRRVPDSLKVMVVIAP